MSDGIPSCIYCFVSKYKYDKLIAVCGYMGVFGNNFNFGHTPERGQRPHTLISASSYPFGKSWYPYEKVVVLFFFFSVLFYHSQLKEGFSSVLSPTLTYTILIAGTILRMLVLQY